MITASMSTFHRVYACSKFCPVPVANHIHRYHGFQTNGELPQILNERNMGEGLVASQILRRSDTSGL